LGALLMRILFLCFASFLVHMTQPLFTISFIEINDEPLGFSVRDLVLLIGGIYLIYKGVSELLSVLNLTEEKDEQESTHKRTLISLPRAVITIMVMDLVFSIDSVVTAVGLAQHLIVMILAVIIAVVLMMIFIDAISNFINTHTEIKILALVFIVTIGALLCLDGIGIQSGVELLDIHIEKLMVYFAMIFSIIIQLIQMKFKKNYQAWVAEKNREMDSSQD
jgi:predicted tellurium resistance membrane protein TerC